MCVKGSAVVIAAVRDFHWKSVSLKATQKKKTREQPNCNLYLRPLSLHR